MRNAATVPQARIFIITRDPVQALEERHLNRSRSGVDDELSLPSTSSSCGGAGVSGASDSVGGVDVEVHRGALLYCWAYRQAW